MMHRFEDFRLTNILRCFEFTIIKIEVVLFCIALAVFGGIVLGLQRDPPYNSLNFSRAPNTLHLCNVVYIRN